jgi:hypothetical protein
VYHTNRRKFRREYGKEYEWPGFGARLLSGVLNILPKIGPLRVYTFRVPSTEDGARFHKSYEASLARFRTLTRVQPTDTAALAPKLPNTNLDTGKPTHPTDYILADVTYDDLLRELHKHKFEHLTPSLQQNILAYFAAGPPPSAPLARYTKATEDEQKDSKKNRRRRSEAQEALTELQNRKL